MVAKTGVAHGKHKPHLRLSTEWQEAAACQGLGTDLFFEPAHQVEAVAFCHAFCDVRAECLAWATVTGSTGVWGGMTDEERRNERRRQQRAARAVEAAL